MRDIRADLRERLEAAEAEAKAATDRVQIIKGMLEAEEARFASAQPILPGSIVGVLPERIPGISPSLSLDDFLVKAVRRGVSDKEELRDAAIREGYFMGSNQAPGRVVHAKLTNLVRDGSLKKVGDHYMTKGA